jgi:glycine/D-amino acid oxidase-like deaminating enzyme
MLSLTAIALALGAALPLVAARSPDIIQKDVVVIGGGASGAYAAVRLRDDFKKSIALIEKEAILVRPKRLRSFSYPLEKDLKPEFMEASADVSSICRVVWSIPMSTRRLALSTTTVLTVSST